MELTSRELATIVIFAAFIMLTVVLSRERSNLRGSFVSLLKALSAWRLWTVILAYLTYAVGLIVAANWLGVWSQDLLKDTAVAVLFVGLPMVANANNFENGLSVVSTVVRDVIGVAALVVVYLNLAPLPLWGELILQTVVLILVLMTVAGRHDPNHAAVVKASGFLLALIGIGLIAHVTIRIISEVGSFDWTAELRSFALSVWLPLAVIPFVYVLAILMSVEMAFVRLKFNNKGVVPPFRVRLALLFGLRGSLSYATAFTGRWLPRMAGARTFRSAWQIMREYRRTVRANVQRERSRQRHLTASAGRSGVDNSGLWQDRREFHATKEGLDQMFFTQMGLYRHRGGRYWTDPVVVFPIGGLKGLSDDHGVQVHVRDDGQAWMAWRRTIGGYWLGVGGTADVDARWRYAGQEPPSTYPGELTAGWAKLLVNDEGYFKGVLEWDTDDAPILRS